MLYAVSVHLASPFFSHKLPCITASYFLHRGGRQRIKKTKKKNLPETLSVCKSVRPKNQNAAAAAAATGGLFPSRVEPYRRGESVYHDFSEFNRRNVMSIKGDKNFNTSICSGSASKPQNLTLGVELLSGCQKMCQVSICFIRCTFFIIILSAICPQQPQTFFIS